MIETASSGLLQRPALRQFVKFCLVGATSAVIDIGLYRMLSREIQPILARCISTALAVLNGFVWNSLWTFRGMGAARRHHQFLMFFSVNLVGMALNLLLMTLGFFMMTRRMLHKNDPDKIHEYLAIGMAIVCVSCWNFFANRYWTFRGSPGE